jgi:predicted aspartyl protease
VQPFPYLPTVSGPYGQYTVDALVDPRAAYTSVLAPALIEMGIQPVRVVRLKAEDGGVHFRQLGHALTTVAGLEDIAPVIFGEPGEPTVVGAATLAVLALRADDQTQRVVPAEGWLNTTSAQAAAAKDNR